MRWERLDEPIKVRADFANGIATPLRFRLGGRVHVVTRVNSRWEAREGRSRVRYFAVSTGGNDAYQLSFDAEQLAWRADGVMFDG